MYTWHDILRNIEEKLSRNIEESALMTSLKSIVLGCVSDHGHETAGKLSKAPFDKPPTLQRVKFGLPLEEAFKDNVIPTQLMDMLVYIAREGIMTTDLFRRPGNPTDLKQIVKKLAEGRDVDYSSYNFYTLASVIKKFLLKIPGGVFGAEAENELLHVLNIKEQIHQFDAINKVIRSLPKVSQKLTSMLFGTWFRMSHHSEFNSMSSESVAKSVAGSLFHTCADDPNMVNLASVILQMLIDNFASSSVFGRENIEFFAVASKTRIDVMERYKYELDTGFISALAEKRKDEEGRNGGVGIKTQDIPSIEECLALFERVVAHDAKLRGIDTSMNAIPLSEFTSSDGHCHHHERQTTNSRTSTTNRISVTSSLPTPQLLQKLNVVVPSSPQSLQPVPSTDREVPNRNSLSSYLSAPDVCEMTGQPQVPSDEVLTKSLSRVESVYRKQLLRLQLRNKWFLNCTPNTSSTSMDSRFSRSPLHVTTANTTLSSLDASHMSSSFSCGILSSSMIGVVPTSDEIISTTEQKTRLMFDESVSASPDVSSKVTQSLHLATTSSPINLPLTSSPSSSFVTTTATETSHLEMVEEIPSASQFSRDLESRYLNSITTSSPAHNASSKTKRFPAETSIERQHLVSSVPVFTITQVCTLITNPPAKCFQVELYYGSNPEDCTPRKENKGNVDECL